MTDADATAVRPAQVRGLRFAALLVGLGLLLTAAPVVAASPRSTDSDETAALRLLEDAARASRALTYSGTKYVAAWRPGGTSTSLVEVRHDPRGGLVMTASPTAARAADDDAMVLAAASLDRALLAVLGDVFALSIAGTGRCTGRDADVVEARRPTGTVAGRFWIDRDSRLLLRREVYDDAGHRVRSSAFLDLEMTPGSPVVTASAERRIGRDNGSPVDEQRLEQLRAQGWHAPTDLPGGFVLFEARSRAHGDDDEVLHLAYTDGLSTTSLFVQRGELGSEPPEGFVGRAVGDRPVWVHDGAPERMIWAGGERVWTLVSDAPDGATAAALQALPHDDLPDDGLRARLARGLSRLGSWLNPFA
ncbi:MAG TPA: sigma-E factor regulatory protein RseB domain-containing protein [Mycobacteriales bacterium]|nr:sigma-E factor regulatory protein RseB domain-containing protein [Mycobacteriales bacterium]